MGIFVYQRNRCGTQEDAIGRHASHIGVQSEKAKWVDPAYNVHNLDPRPSDAEVFSFIAIVVGSRDNRMSSPCHSSSRTDFSIIILSKNQI